MYGGAKSKAEPVCEMLAFFMAGDELEEFEVWPHNWNAVRVFVTMATQWQVAYGGYVGLRYEALQAVFEALGIEQKKRAEVFSSLRILESEALSVINER